MVDMRSRLQGWTAMQKKGCTHERKIRGGDGSPSKTGSSSLRARDSMRALRISGGNGFCSRPAEFTEHQPEDR